jgi:serine protease Do
LGRAGVANDLNNKNGLFISSVEERSPAMEAGFRSGDIIVSFDKKTVDTLDELFKMLNENRIGVLSEVEVLRNNIKKVLKVLPLERT